MNSKETMYRQTKDAYNWLNRLLDTIPIKRWERTTKEMATNVIWQVGHLTMGIYYHSIMAVKGHHPEIMKEIPLKEYSFLFVKASPADVIGKIDAKKLRDQLSCVQKTSMETIEKLSEKELDQSLEELQPPHPIAKTKYEALDWNIKHTMWHCGQLAMINRIISYHFDLNSDVTMGNHNFKAELKIIGINPFVFVPEAILNTIFKEANREKSPIPVRGTVNKKPYRQTLVRFDGAWRLYINTKMLNNSPKRIGETIEVDIAFEPSDRTLGIHPKLKAALHNNPKANEKFDSIPPYLQQEIIRYITNLKTEKSVHRNVERAVKFLMGEGSFVGREKI